MQKSIVFLILISIFCSKLVAQQQLNERSIDKKELKLSIKKLTSKEFEGRMIGTEGQKKAANFIINKFKQHSLKPLNNNSYQQHFEVIKNYPSEVYLEIDGHKLTNFNEMAYLAHVQNNIEVDKEIVFGGDGSSRYLDLQDIRNKVVLIFAQNMRATWNLNPQLLKRGAFAVIYANPTNPKQFEAMRNGYKAFYSGKRFYLKEGKTKVDTFKTLQKKWLPKFIVSNQQLKKLTGLSSPKLHELISSNKLSKIAPKKIKIKLGHVNEIIETENIIGLLNGKSDSSIIISAHYDHLGIKHKKLYPGADDNASGTAGLLELAEYFSDKELEYNLVFLATSAEEEHMLGSSYFVNSNLFNSASTILNLNLDMIGRSDDLSKKNKNYLYCIGTYLNPYFAELIKNADNNYPNCTLNYFYDNREIYDRSDQYSFHKKSIPAIMFFSGLHNDYHMPSDTSDKINYELLQNRVQLIESIISQIQQSYNINN